MHLAKIRAAFRHGARAPFSAKSDAMARSNAFKDDFTFAPADDEGIAGPCAPAETLIDHQARGLGVILEKRGILR